MTISRRNFLRTCWKGTFSVASGLSLWRCSGRKARPEKVFIAKVSDYTADIASVILAGLRELGIQELEIKAKKILLKPNLVDIVPETVHINTHPLFVLGAAEAFHRMGASRVLIAEGTAHIRDTILLLEESGLAEVLKEGRLPFIDLNQEQGFEVANAGPYSKFPSWNFPAVLKTVDYVVSLAKMKTHHWAGVTLAMKNLFGVMPGLYYGWPKNVLHQPGIDETIVDINTTLKPYLAIIDGIVGMEGDGPIMGTPKKAGVLVMGRNFPAVDASCARVMGLDPLKVKYLAMASRSLGPIREAAIVQVGEEIASVRTEFQLVDEIPVHRGLRLRIY